MIRYWLTFVFFLLPFVLFSQNPVVYEFGDALQKYSNDFYDIIETPNKTKWISSENGLLKYDGRKFEKVRAQDQKGNTVFNLQLDAKGKLWFNNLYGQFFYLENDSVKLYKDFNFILKGRLSQFTVYDKKVYLFSSKGIYVSTKEETLLLSNTHVLAYCYVKDKGYFIDTDNEIFSFDFVTQKISNISNLKKERSSSKPIMFSVNSKAFLLTENSGAGIFYELTDLGIQKASYKNFPFLERLINVNVVVNQVFVLSYNGTHLFSFENDTFVYKTTFFKDNKISCLFKDSEANYWFATLKDGIKVVPNINLLARNFNHDKYGYIVGSKVKNSKEIIFYTDLGYLIFFNTDTGIIDELKIPTKNIISTIEFNPKENVIYIGMNSDESFIYHLNSNILQKTNLFNVAKDIEFINDEILYLTYNKSVIYSRKGNDVSEKIIDDSRAYTSHFSQKDEACFITTASGVYLFKENEKEELKFNHKIFNATSIAETNDGVVWFSGIQNQLYFFKNNKIYKYEFSTFVPKEIKFIKAFDNQIWLVTEKGLLAITIGKTYQEILYNSRNSGIGGAIETLEILKNDLVYTSNKEIFTIQKDLLNTKQIEVPNAYFTSVTVLDKEIDFNEKIELTHEKNNIKFSFNSNAFNNAENISYKYRLKNYDNNWKEIEETERSVKYLSIPPGNYVFEVFPFYLDTTSTKVANKITSIQIVVNQPFWKTKTFISIATLFFILILFLMIHISNKVKLDKKNREISQLLVDKKITALQLENLRSQMNPHFVFNALNSIQDYIVRNEKKLASSYLVKFSRLMRLYLEHSQVSEISLKEEMETLELYLSLEKNRFENDFDYNLKYDHNLAITTIKIPSLVLQPFIENAIKHGLSNKKGHKELAVCFYQRDTFFEIVIDDNGVGRKATEKNTSEYQSFATKATEKRVALLNKNYNKNISVSIVDKIDDNGNPLGTTVTVKIAN